MSIIQEHSLLVIGLLLVLLLISIFINFRKRRIYYGDDGDSSNGPNKQQYTLALNQRNEADKKSKDLEAKCIELQEMYNGAYHEIEKLKRTNADLICKIAETERMLYGKSGSENVGERMGNNLSIPSAKQEETPLNNGVLNSIMYASFPRAAGSTIYFSDLTDKMADDSYFELRITNDSGVASFRPLDFMKIRNYDPAMAAILTEGVKPNVASTVVGIEPGEVQLEGNDWIIKKLAKVKLA